MCVCMRPMRYVVQSCLLVPGHIIEDIIILLREFGASLIAQLIKNLPAMQETLVRSLGWEDLLEKGKATDSSILAWRIQKESDTTEQLSLQNQN